MVPGAGKPVNLAHSGKPHGLFHGEGVVAIEPRVVGVGPWYHGVPIQVWMYVGIGLCSVKATTHGSQLALQVEGVVVQLLAAVGKQPFLFLQLSVYINIGDETMVIDGIEGDVNFPVEGIVAGERSEVHRVGNEGRRAGSHERGSHEGPSVGDTIQAKVVGMYIVVMVDIVVVEPDVMGVTLGSILEGKLITILDMIFELAVVHDKPFWLVGYLLFMLVICGLICESGGDLS